MRVPLRARFPRIIPQLLNVLLALDAVVLAVILLDGGIAFRLGPFPVLLETPTNPALILVGLGGLRLFVSLGVDRALALLPRAIEACVLVIVLLAPFDELRTIMERIGIVMSALLLLEWSIGRRIGVERGPLLWLFLALASVSLVSALASPLRGYSVREFFNGTALHLALFVAGSSHFRGEAAVRRLLFMGMLSLSAVLALGFVSQVFQGGDEFLSSFNRHTKSGLYLALVLPIAAGSLLGAPSTLGRIALAALVLFGAIALVLTKSRGAWVSFAVSVVVLAFLVDRRLLFWGAACAALGWLAAPLSYRERALSILEVDRYLESGTDAPLLNRALAWRCAIEMSLEHPLLGAGYGRLHFSEGFLARGYDAQAKEEVSHAHNVYLEVLVEIGVFGLAAFLGILVWMTVLAVRAYRRATGAWPRCVAAGMLASLGGLWVHGLVNHYYKQEAGVLFAALAVALIALQPSSESDVPVGER